MDTTNNNEMYKPPPVGELTEADRQLIEQFSTNADELLTVAHGDGWEFVSEKLDVQIFSKPVSESAITCLKGVGIIHAPEQEIFELLSKIERRGSWDLFFENGRPIKTLVENQIGLLHFWSKSSYTVWARDFFLLIGYRRLTDEEGGPGFVISAKSIKDDNLCPETSDKVRANVLISGFVVKKVPDDPEAHEITYMFQADPAGWVPTSVVNMVSMYAPFGIIGMRKVLTGTAQPKKKDEASINK